MARSFLVALAGLLHTCDAGAMLRQEWQHAQRNGLLKATEETSPNYPELWYPAQTLDHFNAQDSRVFSQRYFANFDHYKPGGPIYINIGGEGPLSNKQVSGYLTNALFAEKSGGATIAVEHRFYGKTQPFKSLDTEHLSYLSSRQALHDLAQFQKWFIASNSSFAKSKFFCMGGSYPGNLAAWYRLEFPEMTEGCWSASGPVHAQEDWPGFGEKVWEAMATSVAGVVDDSVSMKLYAGYEQLAGLIQDPTAEAEQQLLQLFNVCPGTLVSKADRDNMETAVSTYPGTIMQYNNTKEPKLSDLRDIVMKSKTALEAAIDVSKFLNLTGGSGPTECTDNSVNTMYKGLMDTMLPEDGSGNAGRTWTWQTCNEFGYFQTATSSFKKPNMFTRGASATVLWQQVCSEVFGIDQASVGARIAATNRYYGGKQPKSFANGAPISHTFFSNGDLDAWSELSVTAYPENSEEVYSEVARLGSHCVGLYAPMTGEVPGATSIRKKAFELFQKWGAAESSALLV